MEWRTIDSAPNDDRDILVGGWWLNEKKWDIWGISVAYGSFWG